MTYFVKGAQREAVPIWGGAIVVGTESLICHHLSYLANELFIIIIIFNIITSCIHVFGTLPNYEQ